MSLEKKQIARQFSRAASSYDEVAQLQIRMAQRLMEKIPAQAIGSLVDLGCGTGHALAAIQAKTQLNLIGIDLAVGMIEQARHRFLAGDAIRLLVADLVTTGLPNHSVDWVFSNAALQWTDSRTAFAEIRRILKPGGQLLFSTFGPQTLHEWKTAWQAIGDSFTRVHEFESHSELSSRLVAAGFNDIEVGLQYVTTNFQSVDEMLASIKLLGATNASHQRATGLLGRAKYQRLKDHFDCRLRDQGHLTLMFECLFALARSPDELNTI